MELGMAFSETERNRLRLWRRWQITFDHFQYPPQMQRVHQALIVHPTPWTTRALAEYTNLPQTSVRRQLEKLSVPNIDRVDGGFQISELGMALNWTVHRELVKFVRGGHRFNIELIAAHRLSPRVPDTVGIDYEWLATHVWWPVIDAPEIDDA